jgi:hypothetical protein
MLLGFHALQATLVCFGILVFRNEAVVFNEKQHDAMVRSSIGTASKNFLQSMASLNKAERVNNSSSSSMKSWREGWHPLARVRYDDEGDISISHRLPSKDDIIPVHTRNTQIGYRLQHARGREFWGIVTFTVVFFLLLGWGARLLLQLYFTFASAHRNVDDLDWDFKTYVRYVFGTWIAMNPKAGQVVLLCVAVLALLVGTFMYWALVPTASVWRSSWLTFIWLVAPDGGIGETTWWGSVCGGVTSMCGLLIFAILLTLLSEAFFNYMNKVRDGNEDVLEVGHIVIVGLTQSSIHLLHELSEAHALAGGIAIVILLRGISKENMQDMIEESDLDLKGSKIILRAGYPQYENDLERVGANAAKCVVVLADHREGKEMRDAFVMQALIVLRSRGWPKDGHILIECSLLKNKETLEEIGGENTNVVMVDRWLALQMAQVSQQSGLGDIIQQTFSNAMHVQAMPKDLIGHKFCDLPWHFPNAIPLGTISKDNETLLGHANDRCIAEDEDLVVLGSHRKDCFAYCVDKFCDLGPVQGLDHATPLKRLGTEQEIIIIVGWGALMGPFLVQMDSECCSGTRLIIISPKSLEFRKEETARYERRWHHKIAKVRLEHLVGNLGSPSVWDRLPASIENVSRIFLLPDITAADARHADACTIAAIVQIRALFKEKRIHRQIPIVPEIQDPRSEKLCKICNIASFVDSSGMPVQVLASLSAQPRLRFALRKLVGTEDPVGYTIRHIQDYLPPGQDSPKQITFMQCQSLVNNAGDILVGWSRPALSGSCESARRLQNILSGDDDILTWEINPESKTTAREWNCHDRLCVLGVH